MADIPYNDHPRYYKDLIRWFDFERDAFVWADAARTTKIAENNRIAVVDDQSSRNGNASQSALANSLIWASHSHLADSNIRVRADGQIQRKDGRETEAAAKKFAAIGVTKLSYLDLEHIPNLNDNFAVLVFCTAEQPSKVLFNYGGTDEYFKLTVGKQNGRITCQAQDKNGNALFNNQGGLNWINIDDSDIVGGFLRVRIIGHTLNVGDNFLIHYHHGLSYNGLNQVDSLQADDWITTKTPADRLEPFLENGSYLPAKFYARPFVAIGFINGGQVGSAAISDEVINIIDTVTADSGIRTGFITQGQTHFGSAHSQEKRKQKIHILTHDNPEYIGAWTVATNQSLGDGTYIIKVEKSWSGNAGVGTACSLWLANASQAKSFNNNWAGFDLSKQSFTPRIGADSNSIQGGHSGFVNNVVSSEDNGGFVRITLDTASHPYIPIYEQHETGVPITKFSSFLLSGHSGTAEDLNSGTHPGGLRWFNVEEVTGAILDTNIPWPGGSNGSGGICRPAFSNAPNCFVGTFHQLAIVAPIDWEAISNIAKYMLESKGLTWLKDLPDPATQEI